MKFEKLTENKIRIILDSFELEQNNITINSFLTRSKETQNMFFNLLEEAKNEIGFNTTDCKVKIEALSAPNNKFILLITKIEDLSINKRFVKTKIKEIKNINKKLCIYKFKTFDDYCEFIHIVQNSSQLSTLDFAKNISLYTYNNTLYLVLQNLYEDSISLSFFNSIIIEYAKYICNPEINLAQIMEKGTLFIKNNAIIKSIKKELLNK